MLLIAAIVPGLAAQADPTAPVATIVPYPPADENFLPNVYSESVLGDFTVAGNTWVTCGASQYCDHRISAGVIHEGTGNAASSPATNNGSPVQYFVGPEALDRRGGLQPEMAAESSAFVTIPAGSKVVKAILSWNANHPATITPGLPHSNNRVPQLRVGDGELHYPSAPAVVHSSDSGTIFAGYADVTDSFDGVTGPVVVSTVPGPMAEDGKIPANNAAGWAVTVVYAFDDAAAAQAAGHFQRRVQVQQGLYYVPSGSTVTPEAGVTFTTEFDPIPVDEGVHVGFIASEGDLYSAGTKSDWLDVINGGVPTRLTPPWSALAGGAYDSGRDNFATSIAQGAIPLPPIGSPEPGAGRCQLANPCPTGNTYGFAYVEGDPDSLEWYNNFSIDAFDWIPNEDIWTVGQDELTLRATGQGDGYRIQQLALSTPVAQLSAETTVAESTFIAGQELHFSYRVDNPSPITVFDVQVSDVLGEPTYVSGGTVDGVSGKLSIPPGGSAYFTLSYEATPADFSAGSIVSNVTATGFLAEDVTDSDLVNSGTAIISIPVTEPPVILSASLPPATAGVAYDERLDRSGTEPIAFSVSSGTLPAGFSLSADGVLTGSTTTATAAGAPLGPFTIRAENDAGSHSVDFTLDVAPGPLADLVLTPADGIVLDGAEQVYTVEGFDAHGNSRGDVTALVTFSSSHIDDVVVDNAITVDGTGPRTITAELGSVTATTTLTVHAAPAITSPAPSDVVAGEAYEFEVTASGYPAPSVTVTGLPAGLSFNPATGKITGSLTAAGSSTITVEAVNAAGDDSETYTLTVTPGPLHHIELTPSTETITLGQSQGFVVTEYDEYGNSRGPAIGATLSSSDPDDVIVALSVTPSSDGARTISAVLGAHSSGAVLTVVSSPAIVSPAPPQGYVDDAYVHQVEADGFPAPEFEVTVGELPRGLSLEAATGMITGTPEEAGTWNVQITAKNTAGSDSADYEITVGPRAAVTMSVSRVNPGGSVVIDGEGFWPGEDVQIVMHSTPVLLATVTTTAAGTFTATLNIPADADLGNHRMVSTGQLSARVAEGQLTLVTSGGLAFSGAEVAPHLLVASTLTAAGILLFALRRRAGFRLRNSAERQ